MQREPASPCLARALHPGPAAHFASTPKSALPAAHPPAPQPCYRWWEPPYFWAGLRMYDLIAGKEGLEWCRYLTPAQVLRRL